MIFNRGWLGLSTGALNLVKFLFPGLTYSMVWRHKFWPGVTSLVNTALECCFFLDIYTINTRQIHGEDPLAFQVSWWAIILGFNFSFPFKWMENLESLFEDSVPGRLYLSNWDENLWELYADGVCHVSTWLFTTLAWHGGSIKGHRLSLFLHFMHRRCTLRRRAPRTQHDYTLAKVLLTKCLLCPDL